MATILLGVSGSIAAYKAADLASRLAQAGHQVTALLTRSACQLVGPATFLNLTGNRVYTDLWEASGQTEHIALTDRADLVVLAPATANLLAKLVHGIADDMVTTTLLAVRCPVLICPAMNTRMWANPVVQRNVAAARALGHQVLAPEEGNLACGHVGPGRLAEPVRIAAEVERLLGAPPSPPPATFLELFTCEPAPPPEREAAERAHRAAMRARGELVSSARLGPGRWAHVHRAASAAEVEARARAAPLGSGARVEVLPWEPA